MKVDAYNAAVDGHLPREVIDISYIDRFGVRAVVGRDVLSFGEIQRLLVVENIYNAYVSRKSADDWAKWATDNPHAAKILADVEGMIDAD